MSVSPGLVVSVAVALAATLAGVAAQAPAAPRVRESRLPAQMPHAVGGGEVMLELSINSSGAVTRVEPLRITPPYTDQLVAAVSTWRFDSGQSVIQRPPVDVAAPVLVVAVIRPPTIYAGPSLGTPPETINRPSSRLPHVASLTLPVYPPVAIGSAMVLVEMEMTRRAELRGFRVVSPPSGFDAAALDAVRQWRFLPPEAADAPERLFVYAVLGFREPVGLTRPPG